MTLSNDRTSEIEYPAATEHVLQAARAAWEWAGTHCYLEAQTEHDGILGSLGVPERRRIEVVVSGTPSESVWSTLGDWRLAATWRLCALVPLAAMGQAHEHLRGFDYDLQAWWMREDGTVAFGAIEIA